MMVAFIVLAATGLPQKYPEARWAEWIVLFLGGIDATRAVHRVFGLVLSLVALEHLGVIVSSLLLGRVRFSMLPGRKDVTDAIQNLKYGLGLVSAPPKFERFDYKQKFEYWGLIFGGMVMVASGFVLWFPTLTARYLPGVLIPAAKVLHTNEAMLALLVVVVWHVYGAHLSPEVFPADTSIFTGRISRERLKHEHYLEYLRLTAGEEEEAPADGSATAPMGTSSGASASAAAGTSGAEEARPAATDPASRRN